MPPAQASLKISQRQTCSLLPSLREQAIIDLGDLRPTVDLNANPGNRTEPLHFTPLNSCYAYNWHDFQLCWPNPPWSHLEKMVTKGVLNRAQVVVICPDWGQAGEAAAWRLFLDRMIKVRVPIPDVPLYLPDGATNPLTAPRWGSIASLIDGNDCDISLDELNSQVVKFLRPVNRGLTRSDLLKRYGHDTPAERPKNESEVQEIQLPTESDEEQDAGAPDAEVENVDIQWEDVSEEPAEVQWDEVTEDGYMADGNLAQPLKYKPCPSIHEDYSARLEDLQVSKLQSHLAHLPRYASPTTKALSLSHQSLAYYLTGVLNASIGFQALHLTHPTTALEPATRAVTKAWAAHGGWPTSIPTRAIRAAWPHYGDAVGDEVKAAYTRHTALLPHRMTHNHSPEVREVTTIRLQAAQRARSTCPR